MAGNVKEISDAEFEHHERARAGAAGRAFIMSPGMRWQRRRLADAPRRFTGY
jgi:hypothetical protein